VQDQAMTEEVPSALSASRLARACGLPSMIQAGSLVWLFLLLIQLGLPLWFLGLPLWCSVFGLISSMTSLANRSWSYPRV
jgi:hypothetical protein